jgi:hypothetical protein
MSYVAPTPEEFLASFPEFNNADPTRVTDALAEAGRNVDMTWFEEDYVPGYKLYAAHVLALGDLAADTGGEPSSGQIASESLGPISVSYTKGSAPVFDANGLGSTSYGQRYTRLLMLNRGGPRVT